MPHRYSAPINTALHQLSQETNAGLPLAVACFAAQVSADTTHIMQTLCSCHQFISAAIHGRCLSWCTCKCKALTSTVILTQSTLLPPRQYHCICLSAHWALKVLAKPVEAAACLCHLDSRQQTMFFTPTQERMMPRHYGILSSQDVTNVHALCNRQQATTPCQNTASFDTLSAMQIMLPSRTIMCMPWQLLASGACTLRSCCSCNCCYTPCRNPPPRPRFPFTCLTQLQTSPGTCSWST